MDILDKRLIKQNLLKLLEFSGLTDIDYAYLLDLSSKQIKRIRKGQAEFSIDDINKSCDFFDQSLRDVNSIDIVPELGYRHKLMMLHKDKPEYYTLLKKRPSITYAINFELLNNFKFLKGTLSVKEIKEIFKLKGWIYTSSYISLALKRNVDKIKIEKHPTKKSTFVYSKM